MSFFPLGVGVENEKAKEKNKKPTCRSSLESTMTTPSSHPACPTPQRSIIPAANSSAASLAEEEPEDERSRRPRAASAT